MEQFKNYIVALANLYGIVSVEQVIKVYNHQNKDNLSMSVLNKDPIQLGDDLKKHYIYIEEGLFVHEAIYLEEETPHELFLKRQEWPYYVPTKEELLRYVDEHYFEKNEAYKKIAEYLTTHLLEGNSSEAKEITTEIHDYLTVNFHDLQGALGVLVDFGLTLETSEHVSYLISLIGDYAMSIRDWELNGCALKEFTEQLSEQVKTRKAAIEEIFQKATLLEKYIVSLTHLYGRVTKEMVTKVYNLQNRTHISVNEVDSYLSHPPAFFKEVLLYVKYGEFLSEDLFLFEEAYEEIVEAQKGKPFYMPDQEELFLYFDPNYIDYPKSFQKLVDYLQKNMYKNNEAKACLKAEDILRALKMGDGMHGAFYELKRDDYIFDKQKQIHEIANLVKRVHNNLRMRENNGFTPRELSRIEKAKRVERISIGRVDLQLFWERQEI